MRSIEICGRYGRSNIVIGESLGNVGDYTPVERTVIVTDSNVRALYGKTFPNCPVIEIGAGEKNKNLETVRSIYQELLDLAVDRSFFVLGIGGGVLCDITGFVASTFLRGIRFGFVSTTLLSQVDASVGGKNGVNFRAYKNMIGTFNQPEFVLCDLEMLKTLPKSELGCGFAEIVKAAAIADSELFAYLERHHADALALDPVVVEKIVVDSVSIKAAVVNRDEREKGERRKLNLGHTFGHAFEKCLSLSHGEAVSIGMILAARLSRLRGYLSDNDVDRIHDLFLKLGLPVRCEAEKDVVFDALARDKKREAGYIHFVLLKKLGEAVVEEIGLEKLGDVWHDLCGGG